MNRSIASLLVPVHLICYRIANFLSICPSGHENIFLKSGLEAGHSSMQGYRPEMEDSHIIAELSIEDHELVSFSFLSLYSDN